MADYDPEADDKLDDGERYNNIMEGPTNTSRAAWAEAALQAHVLSKGEVFELSTDEITDLIADLLHLVERERLTDQTDDTPEEVAARALSHFEFEKEK